MVTERGCAAWLTIQFTSEISRGKWGLADGELTDLLFDDDGTRDVWSTTWRDRQPACCLHNETTTKERSELAQ